MESQRDTLKFLTKQGNKNIQIGGASKDVAWNKNSLNRHTEILKLMLDLD